jgi:hypothetical protein
MIISCPECAGPFEVPDDRISALVQVACPHCAFRMILDFAAANDPGLVEQGMRMASGFRSAADYHASVQAAGGLVAVPAEAAAAAEATTGEPIAATPVAQAPAPEPARTVPAREPPVRVRPEPRAPVTTTPAATPPRSVAPSPVVEPVRPAASGRSEPSEDARTELHMLPRGAERMVPVDIPPVRRAPVPRDDEDIAVSVPAPATEVVRTVVGPAPVAAPPDEVAIDIDDEDEAAPPAATSGEHRAHPAFGDDEDEDLPTMVVPPDTARQQVMEELARRRPQPEAEPAQGRERPHPPHSPPVPPKVTTRDDEVPAATSMSDEAPTIAKPSGDLADFDDDDDVEQERMSTFGVIVVVFLLLVAGGLVGASVALNADHSPDPRPLLEKLYRQHVKGEAPAKSEAPAKGQAPAKGEAPAKGQAPAKGDAPAR